MDSKAQRYCGSFFDSSDAATRNGQVTCRCLKIICGNLEDDLLIHLSRQYFSPICPVWFVCVLRYLLRHPGQVPGHRYYILSFLSQWVGYDKDFFFDFLLNVDLARSETLGSIKLINAKKVIAINLTTVVLWIISLIISGFNLNFQQKLCNGV